MPKERKETKKDATQPITKRPNLIISFPRPDTHLSKRTFSITTTQQPLTSSAAGMLGL
jgi:hypothetical protein